MIAYSTSMLMNKLNYTTNKKKKGKIKERKNNKKDSRTRIETTIVKETILGTRKSLNVVKMLILLENKLSNSLT